MCFDVDAQLNYDLELLNSNPFPLVVESVHIQLHDVNPLVSSDNVVLPIHTMANMTVFPFAYTTILRISFYSQIPGNYSGIITVFANGTQSMIVPYSYTLMLYLYITCSILQGSIDTKSPIFYCLKPSIRTKILPISLDMFNHYNVPVAVTRVGISDAAATYIAVSDQWNSTRFLVFSM